MFFIDSPCDLTRADIEGKPLRVNSAEVMYDGKTEKDIDVDRPAYYKYLQECKEVPSTAMATPEEWRAGFEEAYQAGYTHAVGMTISTTASSVLQTANVGREMFLSDHPGGLKFRLFDSRAYSVVYGDVMLEALDMNERGESCETIVAAIKQKLRASVGVLGVCSLKCMKKSGRISGMTAFVGEALGLRPVLQVRDGAITPIDKVRGERNLPQAIVDHTKRLIVRPEEQTLTLLHGLVPEEELDRLERLALEQIPCKGIKRHTVGCAVATNCGPEVLALRCYAQPYETELWAIED
jgi:DegV family protein with EDD domain